MEQPRGSGLLNSTIHKLESLTLSACENKPQSYADRFVGILRECKNQAGKNLFVTDENWKVYHFHKGLGSQHSAYREQYDQDHDAFDEDGQAKFTLNYAITRFLDTVGNPTDSTMSSDATALAAIIGGSLGHTNQSVTALVAAGNVTEHKIQKGANSSNSRTFTRTVKNCTICKRDYHSAPEHGKWQNNKRKGYKEHGSRGE